LATEIILQKNIAEANELFNKMDLNKDDKVTFEEFTTVAKTDPFILDILNPKA
jgi:Ca2+-binding EF-hand superfamily protein